MNQIDNIIAVAEEYRTAESAMFRQALRAAIEQALTPGEPCNHERVDEDLITGSWSFCKHCHKEWTSDMGTTTPQPQPQQEPVAWAQNTEMETLPSDGLSWVQTPLHIVPLYTAAPQPQPVQEPVAVPEGWHIAKADNGQVLVSAPNCDPGSAWIKNQGPLPQRILYALVGAMLDAPQPQPKQEHVAWASVGALMEARARAIEAKLREKNGGGV